MYGWANVGFQMKRRILQSLQPPLFPSWSPYVYARNMCSTDDFSVQVLSTRIATVYFGDHPLRARALVVTDGVFFPTQSRNPRPPRNEPTRYLTQSACTRQIYQQAATAGAAQQPGICASPNGYTYTPPGGQQQPMQVKDLP